MSFQNISLEKIKTEWIGELGIDISEDTWDKAVERINRTSSCARLNLIQMKVLYRIHYSQGRRQRILKAGAEGVLDMRRRLGFKSNFAYQHTKNTCIYTYKHSHIHINFHAYTLLNTRTYIYTSKHSHIHIHFHAYTPINTRIYI